MGPATGVPRLAAQVPLDQRPGRPHRANLAEPVGAIAEPYALWAIEAQPGFVPPCAHPDIKSVADLAPYERLKLYILNLGHTVLAERWRATGRDGEETVLAAMADPAMTAPLEEIYDAEVLPGIRRPRARRGGGGISRQRARSLRQPDAATSPGGHLRQPRGKKAAADRRLHHPGRGGAVGPRDAAIAAAGRIRDRVRAGRGLLGWPMKCDLFLYRFRNI